MMQDPEVMKEALTPENMEMARQMEEAAQKLQASMASGQPPDLKVMQEVFASPMMAQLLPAMRANPELLQQVLQNDPTLKQMAQGNPEVAAMLKDPKLLTEMLEKMAENPDELVSDELLRETSERGAADGPAAAEETTDAAGDQDGAKVENGGETPQVASPAGGSARTRDVQMSFWGNANRSMIFIGVIVGAVLLKTVRLASQGKLREMIEEVPNAAYLATTAAEEAELHEFCC